MNLKEENKKNNDDNAYLRSLHNKYGFQLNIKSNLINSKKEKDSQRKPEEQIIDPIDDKENYQKYNNIYEADLNDIGEGY